MRYWRADVVAALQALWARGIEDGTTEGNLIIGTEIIPAGGGAKTPRYRKGSLPWCGYCFGAALRRAGFTGGSSASAGKVVYGLGLGNKLLSGKKAFIRFDDDFCPLRSVHQDWDRAEPGDALVMLGAPGGYRGHVMGVERVSGSAILTIEGNAKGVLPGPDGLKWGHGVVRQRRTFASLEKSALSTPHFIVSMAEADFFGVVGELPQVTARPLEVDEMLKRGTK